MNNSNLKDLLIGYGLRPDTMMCEAIKASIELDDAEDHAHCKEQVLSARRGSAEGTLFENEKSK